MNNKTLFTKAHKIARKTVKEVGDYQIAFTLALKEIKAQPTAKVMAMAGIKTIPEVTAYSLAIFVICCVAYFPFIGEGAPLVLEIAGYVTYALATLATGQFLIILVSDFKQNLWEISRGY